MTLKKIYIIAGEASGDLHGAHLIEVLKQAAGSPLQIYGIGGDKIKATGALNFFDLAHFHVTGFTEALKRLPEYQKASKVILAQISQTRPNLVVLIDNPGFNLHLAKKIHEMGIPVVYYIAPQIWAWAPKRIEKIKKYISKVLVVFEFEKKIYQDRQIPVTWVGHPLKDMIAPAREKTESAERGPIVALLPGSRKGELKMLFSVFSIAAALLAHKIPGIRFRLIKAPTLPEEFYQRLLKETQIPMDLILENSYTAIADSDLAIVCSGTATLECALLGIPMIISNKSTFATYFLAKSLIRVPYLGLPNLILDEMKMPELLQYQATPEKIAEEAFKILANPSLAASMRKDLEKVSEKLGPPGAIKRAAGEILSLI